MSQSPKIYVAKTEYQFSQARQLFQAYASWLGVDLSYQNFDQKLSSLLQIYGRDNGRLLLASVDEQVVGCVGVRRLNLFVCEMKRLYVLPEFRGNGVGDTLVRQIIQEGKALGYKEMVLDTLADMKSARKLYHILGFREIPAYYHNPLPNVIYLKLTLEINNINSV